ncbi:MAG TPA: CoA transferase, partial [Ilumatobacteraceae bacterium]
AQTLLYVNEHLHDALWDGPVDPQWVRSFNPGDYAVVTVASGETVVVTGHPAEKGTFELFVAAIERPELLDDPRFVDPAARLAHLDDLHEILADHAATVPDAQTYEERFAACGLAVGVLRTSREICDTDWAHERGAIVEISDRGDGTVRIPDAPWRFSGAPDVGARGVPRYRGEDNRSVLTELLGLDDTAVDALERDDVLSSRVPPSRA